MKKMLLVLLLICSVSMLGACGEKKESDISSAQDTQKITEDNFEKNDLSLYAKSIEENFGQGDFLFNGYKIIDINSDGARELVLSLQDSVSKFNVFFLKNGNEISYISGAIDSCIIGEGLILEKFEDPLQHTFIKVYDISNNKFDVIFEGGYAHKWEKDEATQEMTMTQELVYTIAGNEVTENEFNTRLSANYDEQKAFPINENITPGDYNQLMRIIRGEK